MEHVRHEIEAVAEAQDGQQEGQPDARGETALVVFADPAPVVSSSEKAPAPASPSGGPALALSPGGLPYLLRDPLGTPLPPEIIERIERAFAAGPGAGLLHLGAVEEHTDLPPSLAWFRDLGRLFMETLCALPDLELRRGLSVPLPGDALDALCARAPPFVGAECLRREVLDALWGAMSAAVKADLARHSGDILALLKAKRPDLQVVGHAIGRVCLHLAENPQDERRPFTFLATYATRAPDRRGTSNLPLGQALREFTVSGNRPRLLSLLQPVQRAAAKSAVLRELLESRALYETLHFTPREAYRFLLDVPALEDAGLVVRVPDFWRTRRRPRVTVTIGDGRLDEENSLCAAALCDFSVDLCIDGEPLTAAEREELLRKTSGLAQIRGRWVEVDGERIREVLDHWEAAQRHAAIAGVPFMEALRLLAGARIGTGTGEADGKQAGPGADWADVRPGDWLGSILAGLRDPAGLGDADPGPALRATLRPYQREGVRWLWFLCQLGLGGCLADDMGLGKTVQVLALLLLLKQRGARGPHLLVVPASLLANWRAEMGRFAPGLKALVAHPSTLSAAEMGRLSAEILGEHDVVLVSYAGLSRIPALAETKFGLMVLDEAQAIRNPAAQQTQAAKAIQCQNRLILTGTPVENRLQDLWSLYDFICPGLLGSAKGYARFVRGLAEAGDYAPLRGLVRPYLLRRLKNDPRVAPDLPDKTEVRAYCSLSRKQAVLYQQEVDALAAALNRVAGDGMRRRGMVLAFIGRFKQICNHPAQFLGNGEFDPADSGKFLRLRELCEPLAARQEKVLVFTQFREMTGPLSRFLAEVFGRPGLVLDGDTAVGKRLELVDAFQKEGGAPFFVLSLKAGGVGLTLTAAAHVIHFDRWWNPAVENQATDRAYRIGQHRNVLVHKFVCRGTIEERIDDLIESKQALSGEVLSGGGEVPLSEMSDEALLSMVALHRDPSIQTPGSAARGA